MTNRQREERQDPSDASAAGKPPQALAAGLYLVATPIGHARDITLRALDALRDADLVACEDTRVTRTLLVIHGIERPLLAYNDHNAPEVRPRLLAALREGRSVVLVSDAGTPLVADPGYRLVQEAIAQSSAVTCVPGASAVLAALSLSGLPSDRFLFAGFLPAKASERRRAIGELAAVPATLVVFESPHRVVAVATSPSSPRTMPRRARRAARSCWLSRHPIHRPRPRSGPRRSMRRWPRRWKPPA
jgi:16S rRNA (cytidine1402-2'-O)-methyltransferase